MKSICNNGRCPWKKYITYFFFIIPQNKLHPPLRHILSTRGLAVQAALHQLTFELVMDIPQQIQHKLGIGLYLGCGWVRLPCRDLQCFRLQRARKGEKIMNNSDLIIFTSDEPLHDDVKNLCLKIITYYVVCTMEIIKSVKTKKRRKKHK